MTDLARHYAVSLQTWLQSLVDSGLVEDLVPWVLNWATPILTSRDSCFIAPQLLRAEAGRPPEGDPQATGRDTPGCVLRKATAFDMVCSQHIAIMAPSALWAGPFPLGQHDRVMVEREFDIEKSVKPI